MKLAVVKVSAGDAPADLPILILESGLYPRQSEQRLSEVNCQRTRRWLLPFSACFEYRTQIFAHIHSPITQLCIVEAVGMLQHHRTAIATATATATPRHQEPNFPHHY